MLSIKSVFRFPFKLLKKPTEDKSTQTDLWKSQPDFRTTRPPPFQRLPLELLEEITSYLPACSALALRQANKHFHACSGLRKGSSLPDYVRNCPENRLDFLCFLERDAEFPKRSFTCSVCLERHPADRFNANELRTNAEIRICQRVWICEHRRLSLADYRKVLDSSVGAHGVVSYPYSRESEPERNDHWDHCCTTVWTARCFAVLDPKDDRARTLCSKWAIPFSNMIAFGHALTRGIENEPAELDFHICPHIKPKDRLTDLLACNIESQLTKKPVRRLRCKDCNARFWCYFEHGYFQIICYRFLGYGEANDPSWISQLPPPQVHATFRHPFALSWRPLRDPTGVLLWILCAALLYAYAGGLQGVSQDIAFQVTKSAHDLSLPLCQRPPRDLTGDRIRSACDLLFLHTYVGGSKKANQRFDPKLREVYATFTFFVPAMEAFRKLSIIRKWKNPTGTVQPGVLNVAHKRPAPEGDTRDNPRAASRQERYNDKVPENRAERSASLRSTMKCLCP